MNLVSDAEGLNQHPHSGKDRREDIAAGGIFTQWIADWVCKVRVNVAKRTNTSLSVDDWWWYNHRNEKYERGWNRFQAKTRSRVLNLSTWFKKNLNKSCVYLRCTRWCDIHVQSDMVITVKIIHLYISSHSCCVCVCVCVCVKVPEICYPSKFPVFNTCRCVELLTLVSPWNSKVLERAQGGCALGCGDHGHLGL